MYANGFEPTSATMNEHEDNQEVMRLTQELKHMEEEEKWLDNTIRSIEDQLNEMSKDPLYDQFAYFTYDDIKRLTENKEDSNSTLLAIRAPKGTTLEVADKPPASSSDADPSSDTPKTALSNQIFLNSPKDEILVYMINKHNDQIKQEQFENWIDDKIMQNEDNEDDEDMIWDEEPIEDNPKIGKPINIW